MKSIRTTAIASLVAMGMLAANNKAIALEGKKVLEVEKVNLKLDFDPVFKKKGGKLFINMLNTNQDRVTIKVVDGQGRVLFMEKLDGDLIIEKAFNFENAFENDYTVVVKNNGKVFTETFVVH